MTVGELKGTPDARNCWGTGPRPGHKNLIAMFSTFCPKCGTRRVGAFRFCRSCGFDFDIDWAVHAPFRPAVSQRAPEPDAMPIPARQDVAKSAPRSSLGGVVNRVLVIGGAIGGAVGVSTLVGWNSDPLETIAGGFLGAPVAGGYLGHRRFLARWARGG